MLDKQKDWDAHVVQGEQVARGAGFGRLRDRIVALAAPRPGDWVVDVGSGTGLLTLALAPRVGRVWAIDSSPAMAEYLRAKADSAGLTNVQTIHGTAISLPIVDGTVDVVVSNYCLHELRHPDKRLALDEALRVLKPGGRLVIGDMMFSLNPALARDRRVVADKMRLIARRGLPGLMRLAKNALRLVARRWEYPANADWWRSALTRVGFHDVEVTVLDHEGGIAFARRAAAPADASQNGASIDGMPAHDNDAWGHARTTRSRDALTLPR